MTREIKALPAGSGSDMFLQVKANGSLVKGESQDATHKGEIEVLGWSWGMDFKNAPGGGSPISRRNLRELNVLKKVDAASVPLMSALSRNTLIDAVLTVRKAGTTQHEYLKISITRGRVTSLELGTGDAAGDPSVEEHVSFSFQKVTVDYVPQGPDGLPRGGMSFEDQTSDMK